MIKKTSGFSLIELLVTLGIIVLISVGVMARYPSLSEIHSVDRASRLALASIRDAEIRAMSIKEDPTSPGAFPAYGIRFEMGANNKYITMFADTNCLETAPQNCKYDNFVDRIVEQKIIPTVASISKLCGNAKSDPFNKNCSLQSVEIVFLRPTPSVFLKGTDSFGTYDFSDVEIVIDQPGAIDVKIKTVGAAQGGQIFIENGSP